MKTLEQLENEWEFECLDGRDVTRIAKFLTEEKFHKFGLKLKPEYVGTHVPIPFTRENVLKELESDVAFAFSKALNQRGLSAGMMYEVVQM